MSDTTYLVNSIYSSDSEEWYSPAAYVKAARNVMGGIDLDPASCALANQVVQAARYFSKDDNGLAQEWTCTSLWCNPPYGRLGTDRQRGQTELWVEKLIAEHQAGHVEQAILLVNAYLYKRWFARLLWGYLVCLPTGRLEFWNARGKAGRSPHASALVYFGSSEQRFIDIFSQFGPVVKAMKPNTQPIPTLWDETA
jgi:ParB family chromosome partitioning protein